MTTDEEPVSPIEQYLDGLLVELLPGPARQVRHFLAEAEAHLRDAAAASVADGMSQDEAEELAVRGFGTAFEVGGAERRRQRATPAVLVRQVMSSGLWLGAVGGISIGVSGVIAAGLWAWRGDRFIIDVQPGRTLSAGDCARWLAGDPGAHTCRQAAISDWAGETVGYRIAAGVLGLLALGAFVMLRRRWSRERRWVSLPSTVVDTVAVTLFGLAGMWLTGLGIDALVVSSGHGSGQWLSAAPVALIAAAIFAMRLLGPLRTPPAIE